MRVSLRWRIFLWYTLVIPVVVVGLSFVAQRVMVDGVRAALDRQLQERTEIVASTILLNQDLSHAAYEGLIEWLTEQQLPYVPAVLRIGDPEREVIAAFGEIPDPMLPIMDRQLRLPEIAEGRFETVKVRGHEALRLYTMPVYDPSSGQTIMLIQTGDSLAAVVEAQRELWRYTLVVGIGGSVVVLVVGFFILQRGFRPLEKILSRVTVIGSKSLGVRIPEEPRPPELQQLADTLNGMLERLETAFRSRETFVASVSHDLRTPLTVLQGQIDVLLMQRSMDEEVRQSLERMAREVSRLSRMTSNLLLNAQLESNPVLISGEIELRELLAEIDREGQVLAEGLDLTVSVPETVYVPGDYDLVKQMVLNVVDNAIKFTPQGGTVKLSLGSDDTHAIIEVSDTGQGIPAESLSRITEPFYKAGTSGKSGRGGTGLGLAIVKQVIDLHHGKLEIQSQEGAGTTITMRLPLGLDSAGDG